MSPAVETLNLTKTFVKKTLKGSILKRMVRRVTTNPEVVTAVDHINLQIDGGELFGLLGPNGAGKTSTIKLLCTLLVPNEGTAKVNGHDIIKEPNKVRQSVGVVTGARGGYTGGSPPERTFSSSPACTTCQTTFQGLGLTSF